MVSSRGIGGCAGPETAARLKYWRYEPASSWVRSDLQQLDAATDPQAVTVIFLHGNRIAHGEAFTTGWRAYRKLVACADERPVRFVIWSWPSDKECGPVQDARIKAARCDPHGYFVGWFINELDSTAPLSLWAHSFGARIATGAMHLLGGGTLAGRRLETPAHDEPRQVQAALLASALDCDWLLPGRRHGDALPQLDGLLLVNNSCDRVLQRYHMLYGRRSCRDAAGFVGLATRGLSPDQAAKVRQLDASCYVGHEHWLANYLSAGPLMTRMRSYLLFEGKPATMKPASKETATSSAPVSTVSAPDSEVPDSEVPDSEVPDSEVPDSATPESESPLTAGPELVAPATDSAQNEPAAPAVEK